jgi:hypothetical protein
MLLPKPLLKTKPTSYLLPSTKTHVMIGGVAQRTSPPNTGKHPFSLNLAAGELSCCPLVLTVHFAVVILTPFTMDLDSDYHSRS